MTNTSDFKALSQQRFGEYAQGYVTSSDHAQGTDLDRLVEIARPQTDWLVLDVATGAGHTALKFAPYVDRVIATDLTPKMLDTAQAHIAGKGVENVSFQLADAEDLPFEDETFDLVTCRIAPHHFPAPARFVRQCARVLKPGALLVVQDHVLTEDERAAHCVEAFERLRDPSHNRALTEREWVDRFRDAGLSVEHTEQLIKGHEFVSWTKRQGSTPEVVERLVEMLREMPPAAAEWMQPRAVGTPEATFINHHLIVAGRKGGVGV
ncbi:MAG: class I SAM-dependent methyltransferase [Anaerolineae bacterium]|nr:class I SAM-dependent methyltransferase [Anaerolineae bacterium]